MSLRTLATLLAVLSLAAAPPARAAELLLQDDFQDGVADGWGASGDGSVSLSSYQRNVSLRIQRSAFALRSVAVAGYDGLEIAGAIAATALEGGDACVIEGSADGGTSWLTVLRVARGEDDGVTLHRGAATLAQPLATGPLLVRLRSASRGREATCWFDDISVRGRARSDAPAARRELGSAVLLGNAALAAPVPLAAFAPAADARPAASRFRGRLTFEVKDADAGFRLLRDSLQLAAGQDPGYRRPPRFDFTFVQVDDRLVPTRRGSQGSDDPWWEWIVQPGRVWSEAADGGRSRAAIPFALEERNANCMHNGVLTFLYGPGNEVSQVVYQVSQETCAYFQFDAWGRARARYEPGDVPDAAAVAQSYERERASRLPVRPLTALADAYQGAIPGEFGSGAEVPPGEMTAFGVVADGVHYVGGCDTRQGPYPFCDELLLPSYSVAKTVAAGLGLMRLELLDSSARTARVTDYLPECAAAGGWDGVTFDHLIDMATGRYDSAVREADEDASNSSAFFLDDTHAGKLKFACTRYPHKEPPGRRWVYHTTDTYLLGAALQSWWRRRHGPSADVFDDVLVRGIWEPLALSPPARTTRRTYDAAAQPFFGWGLALTRDDVAKLATFVGRDRGFHDGRPLVATEELAAALQLRAADPGLPAAGPDFRYNNGLWAWRMGDLPGCPEPVWIPFMSGYGGITIALFPNGIGYYYFSDGGTFRWRRAALAAHAIRSFCPAAQHAKDGRP